MVPASVRIVNTKWHKSRSIVMSEDMRAVVRSYAAMRDASFPENGYFFPRPDGSPYTAAWMGGKFRKFFARSKKDEPSELLPPVRVYDLRHRFATANLSRWLDRGLSSSTRNSRLAAYSCHAPVLARDGPARAAFFVFCYIRSSKKLYRKSPQEAMLYQLSMEISV